MKGELEEKKETRRRRGGDVDEEEEREKDDEMRGRSRCGIDGRCVLETNQLLDESRRKNCESIAQNHCGSFLSDHASKNVKCQG